MNNCKIQLFSHKPYYSIKEAFLWVNHNDFQEDLERWSRKGEVTTSCLYHSTDKFDKSIDLDKFKATVLCSKLISLGVDCKVIEIDYSKEP